MQTGSLLLSRVLKGALAAAQASVCSCCSSVVSHMRINMLSPVLHHTFLSLHYSMNGTVLLDIVKNITTG